MKSNLLNLSAFLLMCCPVFAQDPAPPEPVAKTQYNLLNVPVSPAFILLDAEPVTVEEPVSPTDFFASLRNATTGFTAFPNTYALNFAPGWMFGGNKFTYEDFSSGKRMGQNIGQTTLISMGILTQSSTDTTAFTKASLGFKFSLWPGKVDTEFGRLHEQRQSLLNKVGELRDELDEEITARTKKDPQHKKLTKKRDAELRKDPPNMDLIQAWTDSLTQIENAIADEVVAGFAEADMAEIRDTIAQMVFRRYGFFCDIAGGAAWRFPGNTIGNAGIDRFGFWTTFGYLTKKDINIVATARLTNYQDQAFIDQETGILDEGNNLYFDAGARLIYRRNRLGLSAEAVMRQPLNNSGVDGTSRAAFSLDYQLQENRVLNFTFGKNFDGTVEKGGNLIAVVNFLMGFGGKRPY
ncbi:MAG: hypothetical protein IPJ82_13550 [Lewinellaceae bacterium]|nr:hypothetical protein [Lewinellaceae bacterium]